MSVLRNLAIAAVARLLAWLLGPEPDYQPGRVGCFFGASWSTDPLVDERLEQVTQTDPVEFTEWVESRDWDADPATD